MPGIFQRSAPFLAKVAQFRRETKLPLLHAAGIRDVATARHAIGEGIVDLIGMTRAHIADPHIVNKIMRGEEERIRPCVGASYCLYKKVNCIHNPASGRETTLNHIIERASRSLKVVVVGGGPAGMEAARVSAERGHSVVLMEAASKLGGQILIATFASERRDLIGIVDWRANELERLGVDIRTNTYGESDTILAQRPDVVIVATGGIPDMEWLEGTEFCDSVWDVLSGSVAGKDDVLIYDGTGRQAAPSCALQLAHQGKSVCIATPDDALALEMPYTDKASFRKRISELGIRSIVDVRLQKVARQGNRLIATFRNELTGAETHVPAMQVIVEHGTLPMEEVYRDLRSSSANDGVTDVHFIIGQGGTAPVASRASGSFELHRIGDAISSRDVYSSIYEAYRLCSRI
jgi:thioredoxin reductase